MKSLFIFLSFLVFTQLAHSKARTCTEYMRLIYGVNKERSIPNLEGVDEILKINKGFREKVLRATLDSDSRRLLNESMLSELRKKSAKLANRLEEKSKDTVIDEATQVHDVFVVGAGVQSTIFAQGIKQENPDIKVMVVEQSDMVASNFAMSPDYFRINSTNRPEDFSKEAVPGSGNINRIGGASVQIPDLEAAKYPTAGAIADASLYNMYESQAQVLFKTEFIKSEKRGPNDQWPAKYRITIKRGDKEYYQYANYIANATGLGKEKYSGITDEKSLAFIKKERLKGVKLTESSKILPRFMTFDDARRLNKLMNKPFAPYKDKKIMVIGNGDSGKVTIEHLFKEGPVAGYKDDKAQAGKISKLVWAGQTEEACDAYVTSNRNRYSSIAAEYKNGNLEPVDSKVVKMEDELGGVKVTFSDGRVVYVDHVISATGFEKKYGKSYETFFDGSTIPDDLENAGDYLEDVKGKNIESSNSDFTTLSTRLVNGNGEKEDIFFLGPMVNLIREGEEGLQAGVSQNSVSIFINSPRNYSFARLLASNIEPGNFKRLEDTSDDFGDLLPEHSVILNIDSSLSAATPTGYNEKYLLAHFISSLKDFKLEQFSNTKLSLTIGMSNEGIFLQINDGANNAIQRISQDFISNDKAQRILKQIILEEEYDLNARIIIGENGEIDFEKSDIVKSFRENERDVDSFDSVEPKSLDKVGLSEQERLERAVLGSFSENTKVQDNEYNINSASGSYRLKLDEGEDLVSFSVNDQFDRSFYNVSQINEILEGEKGVIEVIFLNNTRAYYRYQKLSSTLDQYGFDEVEPSFLNNSALPSLNRRNLFTLESNLVSNDSLTVKVSDSDSSLDLSISQISEDTFKVENLEKEISTQFSYISKIYTIATRDSVTLELVSSDMDSTYLRYNKNRKRLEVVNLPVNITKRNLLYTKEKSVENIKYKVSYVDNDLAFRVFGKTNDVELFYNEKRMKLVLKNVKNIDLYESNSTSYLRVTYVKNGIRREKFYGLRYYVPGDSYDFEILENEPYTDYVRTLFKADEN